MNSAGRVELARIPPTVPATRIHVLGPVGPEPVVHRRLIAQIELIAGGGEDVVEPAAAQAPDDRRADQAAVAGDEDSTIVHGWRCH